MHIGHAKSICLNLAWLKNFCGTVLFAF
nr:hypothetical protein [Legionella feeleii]